MGLLPWGLPFFVVCCQVSEPWAETPEIAVIGERTEVNLNCDDILFLARERVPPTPCTQTRWPLAQ